MKRSIDRHLKRSPEHKLRSAVAAIGSTVVVRDLATSEVESYVLVNAGDADISRHRISTLTPAGKAFYGRSAGDVVEVEAPGGTYRFRIEEVRTEGDLWSLSDEDAELLEPAGSA